jgi:hypothetical protein
MLDGNHLVDWAWLNAKGWSHSVDNTKRMINKDRFPRPFRSGTELVSAVWKYREVLPFIRRPDVAQR